MNKFENLEQLMKYMVTGGAISNLEASCPEAFIVLYKGDLRFITGEICSNVLTNESSKNYRPIPMKELMRFTYRLAVHCNSTKKDKV
jgi:hypothetical protein